MWDCIDVRRYILKKKILFFFTLQKKPRKKKEKDPNDKKQSKLKFLNADFVNDSIK